MATTHHPLEPTPTAGIPTDDTTQPGSAGLLPAILTTTEAAALLRVNRKTLYELVRRNKLPGARKLGRSLRFHRDSLLRWMRAEPPHC